MVKSIQVFDRESLFVGCIAASGKQVMVVFVFVLFFVESIHYAMTC